MENSDARNYELMIIFSPELGEKGRDKELDELRKYISSHSGEISFEDIWEIRDLAYRIKKQDQGLYVVLNFSLTDPSAIEELERSLILNQGVLRHLLTKVAAGYSARTYAEYQEEAEKEEAEKEKEKAEKEEKKVKKAPARKPKVEEKLEEKVEAPKEEEPVEEEVVEEPEEIKEEEAKEKLDEVDKKLKSIIDDPDISL